MENIYNKVIKIDIENKEQLFQEQKLELENKEQLFQEQKLELENTQAQLIKIQKFKTKKWYNQEPGDTVYVLKTNLGIKLGKGKNIRNREAHYINDQVGEMIYIKRCYNCNLTEKVLHHILDKHRLESNRELFEISDDLAIYTIDIVCDFLDKFVNVSEQLQQYKIKDFLNSLNIVFNNTKELENTSLINKTVNIEIKKEKIVKEKIVKEKIVKEKIIKEKIVNTKSDNDIKKFIDEYCEIDEKNYVLSYELLGAYRLWSRGFKSTDRSAFTKYMKENFKSTQKYYKEYDQTYLLVYLGIKPKDLIVEQENKNSLPKYEEFILNKCKYNYTYRIKNSDFITEYTKWCNINYPEYIFSKEEQINIKAYINRHFLQNRINMPGYRNVPGTWGIQLKSDNSFYLGTCPDSRKAVVKIDIISKKITEEYESINTLSEKLNLNINLVKKFIKNKIINKNEDGSDFILVFKDNVKLLMN